MPDPIVSLNEESLRADLRELVRRTVEEMLNGLLDEEADDLVGAERYERTADREAYRAGESESESAPFPLTHGVPFRHDAVNGERGHGMGHPSPKYSAEFKQQAVRLYRERGGTYAEIARELGVDAGSISDWVKRADAAQASPEDNPFKVAEENRRLRREVERLRRENEILLKASAFFASRQL